MARGRKIIIAGIVAACLAGVAMASDSTDDDFSKKDIKQCYKDNPGCTGECYDIDGSGTLVCAAPEDDPEMDICGGTKKNSNWQLWDDEGATAACTCADGYVTSAKVVEKWGDSDGFPKASKLCTIDCGEDNVTCEDDLDQLASGPLSCYCTDGTGDKYAEKEAEQELYDDLKEGYETLKSELKDEYLDIKSEIMDLWESECSKEEYKGELADAKADYESLKSDLDATYKEAKSIIKDGEEWDWDTDGLKVKAKLAKLSAKAKPAAKPAAPVAPAAKVAAAVPAKKPVA